MKTLGIISRRRCMADFYGQLLAGLFDGVAEVERYSLEAGTLRELRSCDLYLNTATDYDLMRNSWARRYLPPESRTVRSAVTFTKKALEILRAYPKGTRALLANQTRHMAMESIAQLYHLGISNIEFFPYYPEIETVPQAEVAFAPGDLDMAPPGMPAVDLGARWLTANTVCELALKLGAAQFLESAQFAGYTAALAEVDYSLQKISYHNLSMENKLELILNALDSGIVCEIGRAHV